MRGGGLRALRLCVGASCLSVSTQFLCEGVMRAFRSFGRRRSCRLQQLLPWETRLVTPPGAPGPAAALATISCWETCFVACINPRDGTFARHPWHRAQSATTTSLEIQMAGISSGAAVTSVTPAVHNGPSKRCRRSPHKPMAASVASHSLAQRVRLPLEHVMPQRSSSVTMASVVQWTWRCVMPCCVACAIFALVPVPPALVEAS